MQSHYCIVDVHRSSLILLGLLLVCARPANVTAIQTAGQLIVKPTPASDPNLVTHAAVSGQLMELVSISSGEAAVHVCPVAVVCAGLLLPAALGWLAYLLTGREAIYLLLLPLTLCGSLVGDSFANKTLAAVLPAPMVITCGQALSMTAVASAAYSLQSRDSKSLPLREHFGILPRWFFVAVGFTFYQLTNHLVALFCSLSERTVIMNLCPAISLAVEATLLPEKIQASVSVSSASALALMVAGALLFSCQYPDFSAQGVAFAMLMVMSVVPYRLAQRSMLTEARTVPLMLLVGFDGICLSLPAMAISLQQQAALHQNFGSWLKDPSIFAVFLVSVVTFSVNHFSALAVLRVNSATALQVYQNISNFVVVGLGIIFFGDDVTSSPMIVAGLAISLSGGVWYACATQPRSADTESEPSAKNCILQDALEEAAYAIKA
mmetsp:Transcript_64494/g.154005  ORF Transcript_64494/g.154005 Transcript_64494/m.154005 type:complete len:436 (-) Transcript_64494:13-1320(-)